MNILQVRDLLNHACLCKRERDRERRGAYIVVEEEDPTEEAEEVSGEHGEVDRGSVAPLHHNRHTAVQSEHTQRIGRKQKP